MGIKETPTSNKTYYKSMQAKTAERVELAKEERENLINKSKTLTELVLQNKLMSNDQKQLCTNNVLLFHNKSV